MGLILEIPSVKAGVRSTLKTALLSGRNQRNFFETRVAKFQVDGAPSVDRLTKAA